MIDPYVLADGLEARGLLDLVDDIARSHHVETFDILGRGRSKQIAFARRHAWAVVRWTFDFSYPEIGRLFGVDHTSVLAGVRKYETECDDEAAQ